MQDVNAIKHDLIQTANLLRLGHYLEANERFFQHCELFEQLLPQFPETALSQVHQVSSMMLNAQQQQDWIGLADDLEFDFISLLDALAQ